VTPESLERPYQEFKDSFAQLMRIEEKRDDLVLCCKNIYFKREDIMAVAIQKDFLEL